MTKGTWGKFVRREKDPGNSWRGGIQPFCRCPQVFWGIRLCSMKIKTASMLLSSNYILDQEIPEKWLWLLPICILYDSLMSTQCLTSFPNSKPSPLSHYFRKYPAHKRRWIFSWHFLEIYYKYFNDAFNIEYLVRTSCSLTLFVSGNDLKNLVCWVTWIKHCKSAKLPWRSNNEVRVFRAFASLFLVHPVALEIHFVLLRSDPSSRVCLIFCQKIPGAAWGRLSLFFFLPSMHSPSSSLPLKLSST